MKIIHPKQFKEIRIIIRIQRNIERINTILIKWLYYKELSKKKNKWIIKNNKSNKEFNIKMKCFK